MRAVLLYNGYPYEMINGAIIDAFEYYFAILEHNPEMKMILIDFDLSYQTYLFDILEERYNLDDLDWKSNIECIRRFNIVKYVFEKVLIVDYTTINKLRGILRASHIDVITEITVISDLYTDKPEYMFRKDLYDVTYYGEMPFVYKDKQYRMKLLFDRMKPIGSNKKGYYINSPRNDNYDFIKELNLDIGIPIYFKQDDHFKNFFEYFDVFIYYHANTYFDPHPRLPLECYFHGKQVKYFNPYNVKDGSYYRFKDLDKTDLYNRFLNKYDEIVRLFI